MPEPAHGRHKGINYGQKTKDRGIKFWNTGSDYHIMYLSHT